ncbi:NAD(P)/FAD-dependent oxidoreductase [Paenirhodobacter enshiensis]|uniref:NAD(P)/FAD-dependent oxidoreductase n=1 Tax=Paenirhodobacter enshiensis TaxID=1105367 RepID=UPI0035B0FD81
MSISIPVTPVTGDAELPAQVEVVVIGGGIVGTMTALTLAERGIPVALCEKGVIGGEQSGRNWGWVRQIGRDMAELPLAIASREMWRGMNARIGAETGYRETGIAYAFHSEAEGAPWIKWRETARAHGFDTRQLSAREAAAAFPGMNPAKPLAGAILCDSDGRAEPWLATPAMAEAARRAGARVLTNCAVRTVETSAGRVSGVVTERGRIGCSQVVLAGGAWSRLFAGNLGIDFPQLQVLGTAARVTGVEGLGETAFGARKIAFRRRLDGDYTIALRSANLTPILPDNFVLMREYLPSLLGSWRDLSLRFGMSFFEDLRRPRHWAGDRVTAFETCRTLDPAPHMPNIRKAMAQLAEAFTPFASAKLVNAWAGVMDVTPDSVAVVSPIATVPGFFIASGCSGHGFGVGPALGEMAADLVMGRRPAVDPEPLSIRRLRPALA